MNEKETFVYTYSASEQEEISKIREKYIAREEDKMARLRKLDKSVTEKGQIIALTVGILSALILGTGMSMCMVWGGSLFIPGIIIGIFGIGGVCCAYPLYTKIIKRERERIAPEIIKLTDELLK